MISLIDYGAGNLLSVANALKHVNVDFQLTEDPETLAGADKVIFPGVGAAAASCMEELRTRGLDEAVRSCEQPVLGICLGMQVFTPSSSEGLRQVKCLGILPGHTARFQGAVKLPQIGWNTVTTLRSDPLFHGIESGAYFYFLHSYRVHTDPAFVLAETDYEGPFPSAVRRENFWGVQFHPEKSGPSGLKLLSNFAERC